MLVFMMRMIDAILLGLDEKWENFIYFIKYFSILLREYETDGLILSYNFLLSEDLTAKLVY